MSSSFYEEAIVFGGTLQESAWGEDVPLNVSEDFFKELSVYEDSIFKLILKISGNTEDAQELLNDTMYHAWNSIYQLKNPSKLYDWLCQIARNKAYQFKKDQRKQQGKHKAYIEEISSRPFFSKNDHGIEHLHEKDDYERILSVLHQHVEEKDCIVFLMRYQADNSIAQITEALYITKKEVFKILRRVRNIVAAYTQ